MFGKDNMFLKKFNIIKVKSVVIFWYKERMCFGQILIKTNQKKLDHRF